MNEEQKDRCVDWTPKKIKNLLFHNKNFITISTSTVHYAFESVQHSNVLTDVRFASVLLFFSIQF